MADTDDLVFPVQGEAVDYPQVAPPPAPEPLPTIPVSVTQATNGALNPAQQPTNIAPLDQASSGRISGHAEAETLPNVAPATGDQPDIKPAANIDKDTRFEYTRALTNGEVNDPQDFAERAAGIAGSMAAEQSQSAPTSDEHSQTVNAAKALADALPSHEDLIDHGIALSNQVYGHATPTTVAVIKQNLLDAWVETGVKPDDLVRAAYTEPDLAARLAMPQPTPWQQSPHMPTSDELAQMDQPVYDILGNMTAERGEGARAIFEPIIPHSFATCCRRQAFSSKNRTTKRLKPRAKPPCLVISLRSPSKWEWEARLEPRRSGCCGHSRRQSALASGGSSRQPAASVASWAMCRAPVSARMSASRATPRTS